MSVEEFLDGRVILRCGDNREILRSMQDCSVDSIVTDPPYALVSIVKRFGRPGSAPAKGNEAYQRASAGFMGKQWDTGEVAFATEFWAECLRVLKPGGHVVAFSGTRTYHRMACAIEDAGFEVRDMLSWLYGSGFPKSHDVSKGIDRHNGDDRPILGRAKGAASSDTKSLGKFEPEYDLTSAASAAWDGWGTALKPACEPICFGRKPLVGTVAQTVLRHGTGAINIDGCRIATEEAITNHARSGNAAVLFGAHKAQETHQSAGQAIGRWPANIIHDGSDDVLAAFPEASGQQAAVTGTEPSSKTNAIYGQFSGRPITEPRGDSGSAARFFYTAKADAHDRIGSKHPTVKPVDLMQWLVRLVTPRGGLVLDPFAGTGTTGEAAFREGMRCVLIEREEEYQGDIRRRMALALAGPDERSRESIKARTGGQPIDAGPLFGGLDAPPPARSEDLRSLRGRTIGPIGLKR